MLIPDCMLLKNKPSIYSFLEMLTTKDVILLYSDVLLLLLLLSRFSRVRLCVTPQTAAHQAPPSLGFSRQNTISVLIISIFVSPSWPLLLSSRVFYTSANSNSPLECLIDISASPNLVFLLDVVTPSLQSLFNLR